jgi:hypothetical protein
VHACIDALDNLVRVASRGKGFVQTGPKWPSSLILGEGEQSRVGGGQRVKGLRKKTTPQW